MAITYPLAFPDQRKMASVSVAIQRTVAESIATFDGTSQFFPFDGEWFEGMVTLPPMRASEAYDWVGFLVSLRGKRGTFLLGDPARTGPYGSARTTPGTPLVMGAGQTGKTLAVDGLPLSATGYLKRGDYFGLGAGATSRMYMIEQDVDSNASGQATFDFSPPLRASPADNAGVELTAPKTRFGLMDNRLQWDIGKALIVGIQFAIKERLDGT